MRSARRARSFAALATAGLLALTGAACEEDGTGIDDDVEQEIEEDIEEGASEVEEGISEMDNEVDGEPDAESTES